MIASTDMGHQGMGGEFGQDPQKREDFAHRGVHLTAVASKKLIRALYGRDAAHAYFTGCSDGGREALVEAQRYPGDFDGIVAGAPAMNFQVQNSLYHAWQARSNTGADGKAILAASRLPLLHRGGAGPVRRAGRPGRRGDRRPACLPLRSRRPALSIEPVEGCREAA